MESIGQVNAGSIKRGTGADGLKLAIGFFLDAAEGENNINPASSWTEANLELCGVRLKLPAEGVAQGVGVDFARCHEEGNATVCSYCVHIFGIASSNRLAASG